jgi:Dolichyl-phosphate-mannose-protein mannosyltransferase
MTANSFEKSSPRIGERVLLAAVLACLAASYAVMLHVPAIGYYHDDGIYVVTAKALAQGQGYRIISLPDSLAQTKYPILFPLVLAGVWKIFPHFPGNAPALKLVPFLWAIAWFGLIYRFGKQETGSRAFGAWLAALTAASPWTLFFGTTAVTETMFACLLLATLLALSRVERADEASPGTAVAAGALAAAAFLTRTAGLPVILAGAAGLVWKRRPRAAAKFLLVCALLIAPWLIWQRLHRQATAAAESYYTWSSYASSNALTHFTLHQKAVIVAKNVSNLIASLGVLAGLPTAPWAIFITVFFLGIVIAGFVEHLRRGLGSLHLFLVAYAGMLLAWGWPPARLVLPILPFLLYFGYRGFLLFCERVLMLAPPTRLARRTPAVVLLAVMGYAQAASLRATRSNGAPTLAYETADDWSQWHLLFDWIRTHTPADAVLLANPDPAFYLYTGRKALRGFHANPYDMFYAARHDEPLGTVTDLIRTILQERVGYIVRSPRRTYEEVGYLNALLDQLTARYPQAVYAVETGTKPGYVIYRVDRERLAQALRGTAPGPGAGFFPPDAGRVTGHAIFGNWHRSCCRIVSTPPGVPGSATPRLL